MPNPARQRRSYGGVAPEARQLQRRERLLQAGLELFGTQGFHAATVRQVCAQAQLTERYFYESFASLEKLFAAVYAQLGLQLKQATLTALGRAGTDPLALAESSLRVFFEFVRGDPRRARVLLIEAVGIGQDIRHLTDLTTRDFTDLTRGFMDVLFPEAAGNGLNPELLSAGLIGANIRIATQWAQDGFREPLDEVLGNTLAIYRGMYALWGREQRASSRRPRPAAPARRSRRKKDA